MTRTVATKINGAWTLETVDYETEKEGTYNFTIFNSISPKCLENTNWEFISNNNTGNYVLLDPSCTNIGIQNFIWTIPKEMYGYDYSIMIKQVNDKMKSTTNNKGYRMQVSDLSAETMVWTYEVKVNGQKFTIKLNFIKNN